MEKLQILLLGQFSVHWLQTSFALKTGPASLLAYLALFQGRPLARARVAGALWPDLSEERARANLSTVAWRLRRDLSAQGYSRRIIRASTESLELDSEICNVDVQDFRRESLTLGTQVLSLEGLAQAAHALELYKGDLLEDWDFEWCQLEREELRQRYHRTLCRLAEGFEQRGRYDLALRYAQKAVNVDPLNESTQRILIRILHCTGDRTAAISHFKRFADLARSELGVEPDGETMALLGEMKRTASVLTAGAVGAGKSVAIRPEAIPLIGRSEERQQAAALMDAAMAGTGGAMLILGDAGIGKSKFVSWTMEEWATRGGRVAQGRCIEFNDPIPYQPVVDALGGYLNGRDLSGFVRRGDGAPDLLSLDEIIDGADPDASLVSSWPAGKLRLFNVLKARLDDVARRHPLLLVLEDLQWADAGTVDFLAYLLDRARNTSLAVLLTSRPADGSVRHTLNIERLGRYCVSIVRLGPLTEVETDTLVRSLLGGNKVSADLTSWIHAETEGNPLFVIETLRLFQQKVSAPGSGHGVVAIGRFTVAFGSDPSIPEGVRSAIQQRLRLIDPTSLRIAEIASVLGRSFDPELLSMTVRTKENRLSRAIGNLLRAGIFEREDGGYRFAHDKIRAFCYEGLSTGARRTYHARVAAALAQVPDVPMHRLAWHQLCAGQRHLASDSWSKAGDQAREIHACEEALRAYRYAISCIKRDRPRDVEARDVEEFSLLVKSDEVLAVLGRPVERREILERMSVLCRKMPRASLQAILFVRKALLEEHVGNYALASSLARRAWGLAKRAGDSATETEALRVMAWALNRIGRHWRSLAIARLILRKSGDLNSLTKVAALWQAAAVLVKLGDYSSGMSYIQRAKHALSEIGYMDEHPHILGVEAIAYKWTGNLKASRGNLIKALSLARGTYDPVTASRMTFQIATLDALEGMLGNSLRRLRKASVDSRSAGYTRTYIACLNEVANGIGRLLGNYRWGRTATDRALSLVGMADSPYVFAVIRTTQAQLLLDQERLGEALTAADEVIRLSKGERYSGDLHSQYLECLVLRGALFLQEGDPPRAVSDLESARDVQSRIGERLRLPDTLTYLALAYAKQGDADRALSTSEEAVRLLTEIGYANYQPQRIFWHHYLILEMFDRSPRLQYLERAVEFIEAQSSTLSRAQARRLRQEVRLNREILAAWERHRQPLQQTAGALSS